MSAAAGVRKVRRVSLTDFHPELRSKGRVITKLPIRPLTLPIFRAGARLQSRLPARGVEVLTIADGVGVRLFRPEGVTAPGPALLWIHGGGYVLGTAAQDDLLCKRYAAGLGVTVAAVEYRLAPEYPFPCALDDVWQAYVWIVRHSTQALGITPAKIILSGDSAGGNLAISLTSLCLLNKFRGPDRLILEYPNTVFSRKVCYPSYAYSLKDDFLNAN